jgi:hypothetical protein
VIGKTRYKYDLLSCLDVFPEEASPEKARVSLDSKDYLSCGKSTPFLYLVLS